MSVLTNPSCAIEKNNLAKSYISLVFGSGSSCVSRGKSNAYSYSGSISSTDTWVCVSVSFIISVFDQTFDGVPDNGLLAPSSRTGFSAD